MAMTDRMAQTILGELIGDGPGAGFDSSFLINAASELAQRGVNTYQDDQKKKKSAAEVAVQLQKAISADATWASAEQMLDLAKGDKQRVAAAQLLQQQAMQAAAQVGMGLPADAAQKRVQAANDAAAKAAQAALVSPGDPVKQASMRAWQKVAAQVPSLSVALAPSGAGAMSFGGHGGGNILTKVVGGLPVWGWGAIGIGATTAIVVIVKALKK